MSESYSKVPKTIKLKVTHYFIMTIPYKRELKRKASDRLFDIAFQDFMNLYRDDNEEPF